MRSWTTPLPCSRGWAAIGGEWTRVVTVASVQEFRSRTLLFNLADRDDDDRLSPTEFSGICSFLVGRPG